MKLAQNTFLALALFVSAFTFLGRPAKALVSNSVPQNPKIVSQNQVAGVQTAGLLEDIWDKVTGLGDQIKGLQTSLEDLLNPANLWNFLFGNDPKCGGNPVERFGCWIMSRGMTFITKAFINSTDEVFLGGSGVFDPATGNIAENNAHPGGIWSFNMVNSFYVNQPTGNTQKAFAGVFNNLIPTKEVGAANQARGPYTYAISGRDLVGMVTEIWQIMRNIAYIVIVVILVIFGFAVMFRYKTDPRTVVTAEQAFPGLALGLIAIAFSSLIPALSLDISRVIQNTTYGIFKPLNKVPTNRFEPNCLVGGAWPDIKPLCEPIPVENPLDLTFNGGMDDINGKIVKDTLGVSTAEGTIAWAINWGVLITYITLFASIVMRYASLIIRTVFGPLIIAVGIIPGQRNIIASWLKSCFADGLSIAGIYFMINLAVYLWDLGTVLVPSPGPGFDITKAIYASNGGNIAWVIGLAVSILATRVPAYVDEALGVTPSSASRSGVDFRQAMRGTPLVGQFF